MDRLRPDDHRWVDEDAFGSPARDFATTAWSRICGGRDPADRRQAFAHLADRYWWPIYYYVRRRWGKPAAEAEDLTQEFFAWALESDLLGRVERERGRFRGFLRTVLENFLAMDERARRAQKRGGGRRPVPFPIDPATEAEWLSTHRTPEQVLDEAWRAALLQAAVEGLREAYAREGRPEWFAVFAAYDLAGPEAPTQAALAEHLGIKATDVGNRLAHARTRFRRLVIDLVAESVAGPGDLKDEIRELFSP